jgi:endonuclease/exonuclease/phosphatase family metal-dependent hydrolase
MALVARSAFFLPADVLEVQPQCSADAPILPEGRQIRVLVWNIQYGASRGYHFFYDGGPDVSVPITAVEATLDEVASTIKRFDPDVVLLQEVDRNSRRSAYVDELQGLLDRLDYPCWASTPYHRVPYVPFPSQEHLGRVDMNLVVLSRWRLGRVIRYQLPLLDESRVRRLFNLRRALMEIQLPQSSGESLTLFNTHLSAFSYDDGTLQKQIDVLERHLTDAEGEKRAWLLGGDLNALPPGDSADRLGADEAQKYEGDTSPLTSFFAKFRHPVPAREYAEAPERWWTYQPPGDPPDRTIDYVFHGERVDVLTYSVVQDVDKPSDHLPLLFELKVR